MELRKDEYEKDGVIYCSKCNTPRAADVFKDGRIIRFVCKCEKERADAEEADRDLRMRQAEKMNIRGSILGRRYAGVTFDGIERSKNKTFNAAVDRCKKYCAVADVVLENGYGIYLWGDVGAGKTHIAACMANDLIDRGYSVIMSNLAEISKNIKELADVDFLIFDDLGVDRVKTASGDLYLQDRLYEIVNARYNEKKPTIFTSNYALSELMTDRGISQRTIDRIAEMASAVIKIEGESFRMKTRSAAKLPF